MKTAKFAGAQVVFFFSVEDDEGDIENIPTEIIGITAKEWRHDWATEAGMAVIAGAIAQLEGRVPAQTESNGAAT